MIVFSGAGCELSGAGCPQAVQKRIPGSSRFPHDVQNGAAVDTTGAGAAAAAMVTAAAGGAGAGASTGGEGRPEDMDRPQLVQNAEEASTWAPHETQAI
jgi:hypothetical protein